MTAINYLLLYTNYYYSLTVPFMILSIMNQYTFFNYSASFCNTSNVSSASNTYISKGLRRYVTRNTLHLRSITTALVGLLPRTETRVPHALGVLATRQSCVQGF